MNNILPFLIVGVTTGSLYGLAGMGLVLTYRTSGIFNFGHGAIAAGGAFLFYTLHVSLGWPWPLAAIVTVTFFAIVVGGLLELITRNLREVPEAVVVLATIGILLAAEGILYAKYGPTTRTTPQFLPSSGFTVSGVNISWAQVISVSFATTASLGLYVFLRRSRLGVAMRAVVDNPVLLTLTGEKAALVRRIAWSIGSAFAAISGILLAPALGLDPNLLTLLVVQAFGACAIGLFSSLPMTYLGGIVVGIVASLATKYFTHEPYTQVPSTVPLLFLIVTLLVTPIAKLPQRRVVARSLVADGYPISRGTKAVLAVSAVALLAFVPELVGTRLPLWTNAVTYVIIFGSLALLVWTSGQISLCHLAFVALGATTMAHLTAHGTPWLAAIALAGLATVPVGALVAIPAIRLSGIYLGLITLGFAILMQNVIYNTRWMFGSGLTVTQDRPTFWGVNGTNDRSFYYIVLAFAVITSMILVAINRSRLGRLLRAMSETPTMLATHGLGVVMTRLIVFCISAFFAGIGGALAVSQSGAATGTSYGPVSSMLLLAVLALCGTRPLRSPVLAAVALAVLPGYMHSFGADRQILVFGAAAIVAALLLAGRIQHPDRWGWLPPLDAAGQGTRPGAIRRGALSPVADRWAACQRASSIGAGAPQRGARS